MLRRNLELDFVGGAYVFPGGAVDDHDRHADLDVGVSGPHRRRRIAPSSASIAAVWRSGSPPSASASRRPACCSPTTPTARSSISTIRRVRGPLRRAPPRGRHRRAPARRDLRARSSCSSPSTACTTSATGSRPRARPAATTPGSSSPVRPRPKQPLHDDREVIANLWIRPAEALERHRAGEFDLIFPTMRACRRSAASPAPTTCCRPRPRSNGADDPASHRRGVRRLPHPAARRPRLRRDRPG